MGIKTINVCDCCGKELKYTSETYHISFMTDYFSDVCGSRDWNEFKSEFCESCARDIKNSLRKIIDKNQKE